MLGWIKKQFPVLTIIINLTAFWFSIGSIFFFGIVLELFKFSYWQLFLVLLWLIFCIWNSIRVVKNRNHYPSLIGELPKENE